MVEWLRYGWSIPLIAIEVMLLCVASTTLSRQLGTTNILQFGNWKQWKWKLEKENGNGQIATLE